MAHSDPTRTTPERSALIIIVMGVSGCGKSTVTRHIAKAIGAFEQDADELHPPANIEKMAAGIALTDADRKPWLEDVARFAAAAASTHGVCVIACSALKRKYRSTLSGAGNVVYIYLNGTYELISKRMLKRSGHFMPEQLLASQFAALEDPSSEPNVLCVGIEVNPEQVAADAVGLLRQHHYL